MIDKCIKDWRHCFPFQTPRKEQEQAIDFLIQQFANSRTEYVIAELGTGIGKSAIAITMARWLCANENLLHSLEINEFENPQAYVLTSQKILQDQYMRDFTHYNTKDLRSSSNFACSWLPNQTCAETNRIRRAFEDFDDITNIISCSSTSCCYNVAKQQFKDAVVGVTNYSYLLSEHAYAGGLGRRELLVLDEAHNIENEIRKWATVTINNDYVQKTLRLKMPKCDDKALEQWIESVYRPSVKKSLLTTLSTLKNAIIKKNHRMIKVLSGQYESLDKHICQINRYVQMKAQMEHLILREKNSIQLKPLTIGDHAKSLLYCLGNKKLLMTATVLDKDTFMRSVGISKNERCEFISIPSPFPKENRPIFFVPAGDMSKKNIETTKPTMFTIIDELLKQHANEKGIIHCHTYQIARELYDALNTKHPGRLLIHESSNRDAILNQHLNSPDEPTVLLSPSMTEGVDLKDDNSRFQIICKIPYPYIGDPVVAAMLKKDQQWYSWTTAKVLVQSIGRSIRSEDDKAITYILDSGWKYFYNKNQHIFPKDFKDILHE